MKHYDEIKIELLILARQDVVTASGFQGEDDVFTPPTPSVDPTSFVD